VPETLLRLLPVIAGMAAGYSLRRLGMVNHHDGETVFKLVFYVFIPAVIFISLSTVDLGREFILFPVVALILICSGYLVGRLVAARAKLDPVRTAVLLNSCMVVNTGFATHEWFDLIKDELSLFHGIVKTDRLIVFGGGVPIHADGDLVGAVGVSGGSADQDRQIAEAGATAIG
jgi:predicted permease